MQVIEAAPTIIAHDVRPALRPLVAGIVGFDETVADGRFRVQPAGTLAVVEVSFTSPLRITDVSIAQSPTHEHHAFVAGLMPRHVNTAFFGRHASVQIYIEPLAAPRIFGVIGRDLAARVIGLSDLAPSLGNVLPDRLAHAADWRERFEIVDSALLELWAAAAPPDPLVDWMWGQLAGSGGQVRIAELARRSGWSERLLSARFTKAVGVSPKQAAGVIRFERVHSALGGALSLAELAIRHGFADQSHLTREVRRYSGESPLTLARAQRPTAQTAIDAAYERSSGR